MPCVYADIFILPRTMHITKCKLLDGSVREYHSATKDFDLGDCSQLDFNYLGQGIIYSINGVLQPECTTERFYFWEKTHNKNEDQWVPVNLTLQQALPNWYWCHSPLSTNAQLQVIQFNPPVAAAANFTTIIYDDPYEQL